MIGHVVRRVRQNHGLEHATVAVLLEEGVRPPLGGYSTPGGFFIFSRAPTEVVTQAAYLALDRMKEGQRELAISPYCGTNLVTGAVLAGLVSSIIMGRREGRLRRLPTAAVAILGATLVSRPLGMALQRRATTLADVADLEIISVRRHWLPGVGSHKLHRIDTGIATG